MQFTGQNMTSKSNQVGTGLFEELSHSLREHETSLDKSVAYCITMHHDHHKCGSWFRTRGMACVGGQGRDWCVDQGSGRCRGPGQCRGPGKWLV